MNPNKIYSVMYTSRNENGMQECEVEFTQTFWQKIFKKPATIKTWVFDSGIWFEKTNMEVVVDYNELTFLQEQHRDYINRMLIYQE